MKIETTPNGITIPFHSASFANIQWVKGYEHNALMIRSLTQSCFWAVIKLNELDSYEIVAFPHKDWFDEWYGAQKVKPDVIFSQGISKKKFIEKPNM